MTGSIPLKRLISRSRPITYGIVQAGVDTPGGVPYIRPTDMTPRDGVRDQESLLRTTPEIAAAYLRSTILAGDIVLSIGPSYGKVMVVPESLSGANLTQGTARLASGPESDARFLYWAVQTSQARDFWDLSVAGATFRALNLEPLSRTPIPLWPLEVQRRIADFLDDQIAILDLAIRCRTDQIDLVKERAARLFDAELTSMGFQQPQVLDPDWTLVQRPEGWRVMHLSRVLMQLTNGYVGPTRDILRDSGVRYIQGTHIKNGQIDFDRRPFYVDESWHVARRRINLRCGDVLIVQTGDIGQVAVVPPDFGDASCHALLIARVNESVVSGRYLGAYLRSTYGYQSLISRATGALHPHLEGGIRDVPVVVPPLDVQESIVRRVDHLQQMCTNAVEQMGLQVAAFHERKHALITAAVTGEFDVTTARSVA